MPLRWPHGRDADRPIHGARESPPAVSAMTDDGNVTLLLARLNSYAEALQRHNVAVTRAYENALESLTHLRQVYAGAAADDFMAHWDRTTAALEHYVEGSRRLSEILEERIATLRKADEPPSWSRESPDQSRDLQPSCKPEKSPWWGNHADQWADPAHRRDVDLVPSEQRPAPFRSHAAARVPDYEGRECRGSLDVSGRIEDLRSGEGGPSDRLPKPRPGMHGNILTHVEAHASAVMRMSGAEEAVLYINREPCRRKPVEGRRNQLGCDAALPFMLPPGAKLTVYGPDGFCKVYRGKSDSERTRL